MLGTLPRRVAEKPQRRMFDRVEIFVRDVRELKTQDELAEAIGAIAAELGFHYFALTHHLDVRRSSDAIRLHNYPDGWAEWFDDHSLGATDPVHRASNLTSVGFAWSALPEMIALTAQDRRVLDTALHAAKASAMASLSPRMSPAKRTAPVRSRARPASDSRTTICSFCNSSARSLSRPRGGCGE